MPLRHEAFDNIISFTIHAQQILPSAECESRKNTYDNCFKSEALTNCSLPFEENSLPNCTTFEDGLKAFRRFNRQGSSCNLPCSQIKIEHIVHPSKMLYSIINPNVKVAEEHGYDLKLPKQIEVLQMAEDYNAISFIAEIGGWSGLFIGISLVTLVTNLGQLFQEYKISCKTMKQLTIIVSSLMWFYVCYSSISKYFSYQTGNAISLQRDYSNVSISICTEKNLFSNSSFLGENSDFWMDGNDLSSMIRTLKIYKNRNGIKHEKIYNSFDYQNMKELKEDLNLSQMNWIFEKKIEFCHTMNVDDVTYMKLFLGKEVYMYLHQRRQFYNLHGKTRITLLPKSCVGKTKSNKEAIQTTLTNLNLQLINSVRNGADDYDSCFIGNMKEKMSFIYHPNGPIMDGIKSEDIEHYKEMSEKIGNLCQRPAQEIIASYDTHSFSQVIKAFNSLNMICFVSVLRYYVHF